MKRRDLWMVLPGLAGCALPGSRLAPKFYATTMGGEQLTAGSLQGKPVLIQFWATWCGMCRRDEPAVEALQEEFQAQGLTVLAVNVGEDKDTVKQYLVKSPRAVKLVLQQDTNLPEMFAVSGFPHYVLVDKEGFIAGQQRGSGGEPALRALLAKANLG